MEDRHDAQLKSLYDICAERDKKYIAETFYLETAHSKILSEMQLKFD